ncbi:MAG TPA: amidase [Acidimicrobiia bacterium]|nr:amidase [Acidimicrobiia bacterium]
MTEQRSAIETADAIRTRATSAVDVTTQCLDAIGRRNPELNAFVHLDGDRALAAAAAVDRRVAAGDDPGPLAGVPFGVKDLDDCAGMPTTHGSRWYLGRPPVASDALHVGRLRAVGAIPLGKTAAPEFGTFAYTASPALGVTRNPWNPERTPGGSSGGSAAAIAADMVPFATSSDGGGSTRTPAGFTGLVGLKCSYGRIPDADAGRYAQTAVPGALATTVADSARLLDIMAGPHRRDRSSLPAPTVRYEDAIETLDVEGLRIAWSSDLGFAIVDPEVEAIAHDAFAALVKAGSLALDPRRIEFKDPIPVWARISGVDMWVHIPDGCWPDRADDLDPRVRPGFDSAARVMLPKFGALARQRLAIEDAMADLFDTVDVLATPMTAITAFAAEGPMPTEILGQRVHAGMSVPFAMLSNLWGSPAISVPAGVSAAGMPVGLHLMADRHRDDVCLRLARVLEQARPWPRHAPIR